MTGCFLTDCLCSDLVLLLTTLAAGGVFVYLFNKRKGIEKVPYGDGWWGAGEKPQSEDEGIYPFKVETSDEEIKDLHQRIDGWRYTEPLEDARFHYGFNATYMKKVAKYWRNEFDWKKQVAMLNTYPHFKTKIEGLDVHFIRVSPPHRENQKVIPLMLVHGWPGSFYEFYKVIPLLTQSQGDFVFEVICPSIPGYGYSEAPHKTGFTTLAAARVFLKLMERLGFSEFYLQGGDWGSLITTNMAQMKPESVKGLHLNMLVVSRGLKMLLSIILGPYFPTLVGFTPEDVHRLYPFVEKNVYELLKESGYLHIQATKPDTAGCGVNDSPVGLAAYILEKFSTATNMTYRDLEDGGLERKFSLEDLLTNVMIYWTSRSIVSSMRFYKENLSSNIEKRVDARTGIYVPTGFAAFPQEVSHVPESWAKMKIKKLYSYTSMPRGGHFAAMEEPQLLANDVIQFVQKVERN